MSGKATKTTDRSRAPAKPAMQASSRTTHARFGTSGSDGARSASVTGGGAGPGTGRGAAAPRPGLRTRSSAATWIAARPVDDRRRVGAVGQGVPVAAGQGGQPEAELLATQRAHLPLLAGDQLADQALAQAVALDLLVEVLPFRGVLVVEGGLGGVDASPQVRHQVDDCGPGAREPFGHPAATPRVDRPARDPWPADGPGPGRPPAASAASDRRLRRDTLGHQALDHGVGRHGTELDAHTPGGDGHQVRRDLVGDDHHDRAGWRLLDGLEEGARRTAPWCGTGRARRACGPPRPAPG